MRRHKITKRKPWTVEEERQLRDPLKVGESPEAIAEKMGNLLLV
jgi:hypothetical protein